jgi:hypothetical protein
MPSERPEFDRVDLYCDEPSPAETAEFSRKIGGAMHWSSGWCGLIRGHPCGFRDGTMCDGWCFEERKRREAK